MRKCNLAKTCFFYRQDGALSPAAFIRRGKSKKAKLRAALRFAWKKKNKTSSRPTNPNCYLLKTKGP